MFENQGDIGIMIPEDIRLGVVNDEEWAIEALKRSLEEFKERMKRYEWNENE
jgi:hypothetical protein